jgi:ribose 5-phosphate isomerase B
MEQSKIIIGCDHAAFGLKEKVKAYLFQEIGISLEDVGAFSESSVDYPDFGIRVAGAVSQGKYERGILICGTGLGMSMVANRFPRVRAALCNDLFSAKMSRKHNDANILVMGGRVIGDILAFEIVKTWIGTSFEGGRHQLRLDKFDHLGCVQI